MFGRAKLWHAIRCAGGFATFQVRQRNPLYWCTSANHLLYAKSQQRWQELVDKNHYRHLLKNFQCNGISVRSVHSILWPKILLRNVVSVGNIPLNRRDEEKTSTRIVFQSYRWSFWIVKRQHFQFVRDWRWDNNSVRKASNKAKNLRVDCARRKSSISRHQKHDGKPKGDAGVIAFY